MNDRQRLEAIVSVVCRYLPPDGIPINDAMSEIISYVDPLPPATQPAQEPVAWAGYDLEKMCEAFDRVIEAHHSKTNPFHDPVHKDAYFALRILRGFIPAMKSYTTPPKRPWVGLTDEERDEILDSYLTAEGRAHAIDVKL